MGHPAAACSDVDDDVDDYEGLSFDEILMKVKEKAEKGKYAEERVTDLLTKIVMEGFVWYHVAKPKMEYLCSGENSEFANPLGKPITQKTVATPSRQAVLLNKYADDAANKGIKRPQSRCPKKEEEGEEKKKGEERPRKSVMEKKPITKKRPVSQCHNKEEGAENKEAKRPRKSVVEKKQNRKKSNAKKKQEAKKKKKNSKRFNLAALGLEPPPAMPEDLKRIIEQKGGTDITLVIIKQLFETDHSRHHDRFSMPLSQMREGLKFLTEDQIQLLKNPEGNKKPYVPLNLLQPGFDYKEKRGMALRRWESNCETYNITTTWHEVVHNSNLKVDDILQVWSFRVGEELWFAMVKVMDSEEAKRRDRAGREQQDNGGGGSASSGRGGHEAAREGAMEALNISPSRDQEENGNIGATARAGGQDQLEQD